MIFLSELPKNNPYSKNGTINEVEILYSAIQISKKLVELIERSLFMDIQAVYLFMPNPEANLDSYKQIYNEFNLSFAYYLEEKKDYAKSIKLEFLSPDELNKLSPDDRGRISRLVSRIEFITSLDKLEPALTYLISLPISNKLKSQLLAINDLFLIPERIKENYWAIGQDQILSGQQYKKIQNLLDSIVDKERSDDWEEYNYKHGPLIQQFGEDYFDNLQSITFGENSKNKIYFHGEDFLIAKKSIDYYMVDHNYSRYDLKNGLIKISEKIKKIMFAHVEVLDNVSLNELRKYIWPIEIEAEKIAVQGLKIDLDFYLDNFTNIQIPNSEIVQKSLSRLFISLLLENNKLSGDVRKLYRILQSNGFYNFFQGLQFLSELKQLTDKIHKVEIDDLLYCPEFWLKFQEEINNKATETSMLQQESFPHQVDHWQFNEKNGAWTIVKNGNVLLSSTSNAFTYLAIILKYHQTHDWESMHGYVLQRAVKKFENKDYKEALTNAKPSGAWRVQKTYLKRKIGEIEITEFLNKHIDDAGDNILVLDKNNFQFDIVTSIKIDKDFFKDLSSDSEPYK